MGQNRAVFSVWRAVNQRILKTALHNKKAVMLDIDATEIICHKAQAQWTYKVNAP